MSSPFREGDILRRLTTIALAFALTLAGYPILLIDGRYLITGANSGGYTNAARLANHVIRKRLAERGW